MKRLVYGTEEINLADDQDTQQIANEILLALRGEGQGPWVEVTAQNKVVHTILVSPGVHIRFAERDRSDAPRVILS